MAQNDKHDQTARGCAVAMVAMSKALAAQSPAYVRSLAAALQSAADAGIGDSDLAFLRMLVKSAVAATPSKGRSP